MTIAHTAHAEHHPSALESISVMKFGPHNVLFVGDSRSATVFAFELGAAHAAQESLPFNLNGIDQKIADLLGAAVDQISVKDMVVHPVTREAYIAVHRGHGDQVVPVIVRVNQKGEIHPVELGHLAHTTLALPNPARADARLWNHVVARSLSITDLEYVQGELFVSGLSSADFSSTLYRIPYPFQGTVHTSSIEMYHAMHGQNETRAPIQTLTVLDLGDRPHVLAAYTCTPLVPVDQLADGAHVEGKTIGELGYGNAPIDMLHFRSQDMHGHAQDHVLITHKARGPMLFTVESIAEKNAQDGLSGPVGYNIVAPQHTAVPLAGLIHVDDQDQQFLASLRRDMETGRLDLVSFKKGLYFRVSDFVSEYMLPGFPFAEMPAGFKQFYGMMQKDEGFA